MIFSMSTMAHAAVGLVLVAGGAVGCASSAAGDAPEVRTVDAVVLAHTQGSYVADLTLRNVLYEFDSSAGALDYGRVTVHTRAGESVAMDTWLQSTGAQVHAGGARFRLTGDPAALSTTPTATQHDGLGTPSVTLRRGGLGGGVRALGYTCGGIACTCSGDADCNDMFSSGVCGDIAGCDTTSPVAQCGCLIF